jgi:hypothetical protein
MQSRGGSIVANGWRGSGLAAVALLAAAFTHPAIAAGDGLGTADQKALDLQSVRIFSSLAFQARLGEVEAAFTGDKLAAAAEAKKMIAADAAAIAFNALQLVVDGDPERPKIMWSGDAVHHWFGVDVPFASYGLNNPDNIYRVVPIDGASRYVITGRLGGRPPAQSSYFLYNSVPGDGTGPIDGPIDGLLDKDIKTAPDGTFTIAIDGDPKGDQPNHIKSRADARLLIIRESMADWAQETPAQLSIKRIGGPEPKPAPTEAGLADRTLTLAPRMIAFWLKYPNAFIFKAPANTIGKPNARGGGFGYTVNGHFAIAADEALMVTLDPATAAYVGFQLADLWAIPFEFVHHTSSLANGQAKPNSDGTITYVIAARDPGVYNWLDTTGLLTGVFGIRWQKLTDDRAIANAIRSVKLVKLADLASALPTGAAIVSEAERKDQLAQRAASWNRRLQ